MTSERTLSEIMTPKAVMKMLDIGRTTLYRFQESGTLRYYKLGRKVYFRRSEVIEAITANPIQQTTEDPTPAA